MEQAVAYYFLLIQDLNKLMCVLPQIFRRTGAVEDRGCGNTCALWLEEKGREGLTWLVEGNWLTSAMKFMTKGVAGRSKISFGVPTCSMRPLQHDLKISLGSTNRVYRVYVWVNWVPPEGHNVKHYI